MKPESRSGRRGKAIRIAVVLAWILGGCAGMPGTGTDGGAAAEKDAHPFGIFSLPSPKDPAARDYLGVPQGPFKLTQVRTRLLVIEAFSMYCPHCQREAPYVNTLFDLIRRKGLEDRIKIIGIGVGNTAFEVETFQRRYKVPFPLFADEDLSLAGRMGVERTPTFLAIRLLTDGGHRHVLFHPGRMDSPEKFLADLEKLAGP